MLPDFTLDDENYEDILNEAKSGIVSLCPEWTNFNEHDPGITLLELFAALKESQQYYMDQIGEESLKKYGKLLGTRRRAKRPAGCLVRFESDQPLTLMRANKLYAGDLCFETQWNKELPGQDVAFCFCVEDGECRGMVSREQLAFGQELMFFPFGEHARKGNSCYLCFDRPLPVAAELDLYIRVQQESERMRTPLTGEAFEPLAVPEWEYYTADGWEKLRQTDGTYGFLYDGFLRFTPEKPMERLTVFGHEGYYLRAVLADGEYDRAPRIQGLGMNLCLALQTDTLAECVIRECLPQPYEMDTELSALGDSEAFLEVGGNFYPAAHLEKSVDTERGTVCLEIKDSRLENADRVMYCNRSRTGMKKRLLGIGTGFPFQEIDLDDLQCDGNIALLIEDIEHPGGFRLWEQVDDFAASTPESLHYVVDSQKGIVSFGDCVRGMAPEGEILLCRYVRTMGSSGNIKKGKLTRFGMEGAEDLILTNIRDGSGGCDEETENEWFLRARKLLKRPECAVAARDYERYVMGTPGLLLEGCRVLSADAVREFEKHAEPTAVYIVVKPCTPLSPALQEKYERNILGHLEPHRMLGSPVFILFPEYAEIVVYVEAVVVKPQFLHVKELIQKAVGEFFDGYRDAFGSEIPYSRLYGYLDRQEFILGIRSLDMDARGDHVKRNRDGDILMSPNGIAVLKEVRTVLTLD